MNMWQKGATATFALLVAATSLTGAAPRRVVLQDGWLAWQGCWRADGVLKDEMLCVVPDGDGARMLTVVLGKIEQETRVTANGVAQPVDREGCRGTEQAFWSNDQQRVFTVSKLICGEQMTRKVTGIMSMISPTEWVSVQAVNSAKQTFARTTRYQAVPRAQIPQSVAALVLKNGMAAETARLAASNELDLDDVVEATKNVDTEVVNEWLTATAQRFDLTGRKLIQLADAGLPASVIDVLVAVSNPDHFAVKTEEVRPVAEYDRPRGGGYYDPCYDSWYYGPYGGYPMWSRGYGSYYGYGGYNRCYYSPWGYDPWGWRNGGTVVIVRNGDNDEPSGNQPAKATRGGYTGGTSRGTAHPRNGSGTSQPSGTATPRASGGSSGGGSSTGAATHGGASVSGGGYSGGTSTGAVAKPKDKN